MGPRRTQPAAQATMVREIPCTHMARLPENWTWRLQHFRAGRGASRTLSRGRLTEPWEIQPEDQSRWRGMPSRPPRGPAGPERRRGTSSRCSKPSRSTAGEGRPGCPGAQAGGRPSPSERPWPARHAARHRRGLSRTTQVEGHRDGGPRSTTLRMTSTYPRRLFHARPSPTRLVPSRSIDPGSGTA
jgi:hypothetical protein